MLNFNGKLLSSSDFCISNTNRAFRYGDAIFETVNVISGRIIFWEDHYFRLMASMRMLRMEIPMEFTLEYLQDEILKMIDANKNIPNLRIRLSVFRKDGGLYMPNSNQIDYLIEVSENIYQRKEKYKVDLYKDFYNYSGMLSTIKTNNRMLNTLASIYMKENELNNCILINENKSIAEAINANIFIVKDNIIKTPTLKDGCIKGVVRKKVIEILSKSDDFIIEETSISPFEMQKSDEVFITNSIIGIQPVTNYRKKKFRTEVGDKIAANLRLLQITSN